MKFVTRKTNRKFTKTHNLVQKSFLIITILTTHRGCLGARLRYAVLSLVEEMLAKVELINHVITESLRKTPREGDYEQYVKKERSRWSSTIQTTQESCHRFAVRSTCAESVRRGCTHFASRAMPSRIVTAKIFQLNFSTIPYILDTRSPALGSYVFKSRSAGAFMSGQASIFTHREEP